jgi:hypothetical protein
VADIPDYATHYHLADKQPFLNLSDLSQSDLGVVVADMTRRRGESGLKRVFGPRYMALRRLTEARLRDLFIAAGGSAQRQAPHYLCLGPCEWFRGLAPDMCELRIPLSELPDEVTSFTYPDSFLAMGFLRDFGLPHALKPYHERVFRMSELADIVAEYGLPEDRVPDTYDGYWKQPLETFIEIQVWADVPALGLRTG